jgi:hypothetical protein
MIDNTNPLRQYFRRPALYLKLPSGGEGYSADAIDMPENKELPIYPMTSIDEITCRTPDALYNGTAVVEVIQSCVPNIKNAWQVNNVDLDPLLVAIRIATNGDNMELENSCPKCKETSKYDANLPSILAGFKAGSYAEPISVGDLTIKLRPLTYSQMNKANEAQFQIQKMLSNTNINATMTEDQLLEQNKKNSEAILAINNLSIEMLSQAIEFIRTPELVVTETEYILDFLKNCNKNVYNSLRDKNGDLRKSTETKPLTLKCTSCDHEYTQDFTINMTDFFD